MHDSDYLKSEILDFIANSKDGIFTSMMISSDWMTFSSENHKLASDITKAVFEKLGMQQY
jgi:hypothetical protein